MWNTQTYSKCPLFRGAGCCQQVRVSLVVAETMVLFAFVSCCGASSRLVNFLTVKVFKFYFMFDLNFFPIWFNSDFCWSVARSVAPTWFTCFHALSVTKCQMLRWGLKQLFYYWHYFLLLVNNFWPFIAGVKRLISCHQQINFTWAFLFFLKTSQVQELFLSNNVSSPQGGGLLTASLCEKINFKHTAIC